MNLLNEFIKQYFELQKSLVPTFESNIKGLLKEFSYKITQERFSPSAELKTTLKNLTKKIKEPLKINIMGLSDSGKSTFSNIILKTHIIPAESFYGKKLFIISYGDTRSIIAHNNDNTSSALNSLSLGNLSLETLNKISHFEIKLPLEFLKNTLIYKHPDIDIQNEENLNNTINKIQQSDILLWLKRVDDLSNLEELNLLKPHIMKKKSTSLCILSHIDILEKPEDIIPALNFSKEHFGSIFSDILPISPMIFYKELALDEQFFLQQELQKIYQTYTDRKHPHKISLETSFQQALQNIEIFYKNPISIPKDLQNQKSNFNKIIEYLELNIIPLVKSQKETNIKANLLEIINKLSQNYQKISYIYTNFLEILDKETINLKDFFIELKQKLEEDLNLFLKNIQSDQNNITQSILKNIQEIQIDKSQSFMGFFTSKSFKSYTLKTEEILQELTSPKSRGYRTYKAIDYKFEKLRNNIGGIFEECIQDFNTKLKKWQFKNEFIKKKESIFSDYPYNDLKVFASKVYENIILDFIECIFQSQKDIQTFLYKIHTQFHISREIHIRYILLHISNRLEQDNLNFIQNKIKSINKPLKEEISAIINEVFCLKECQEILQKNPIEETFKNLINNISEISKSKKILIHRKIFDLQNLENQMKSYSLELTQREKNA